MKKLLALIVAAMMLVSVGCAWAESMAEELGEITFQDIPWGSSMEEVKSWAKEKGFQEIGYCGTYIQEYLDASGKYVTGASIMGNRHEGEDILQVWDNASFQIAGYPIYRLDFHFDVQEGQTKLNTVAVRFQSSELVSSLDTYEQTKEQAQAMLEGLEQELITIYGENEMPSTDNSSSRFGSLMSGYTFGNNSDRYRKAGAEDTAVCLTNQTMNGVMLVYCKTNAVVTGRTDEGTAWSTYFDAYVKTYGGTVGQVEDEKAAVEITFQDIPWGSSVEEVASWAKENGFQSEVNTRPMKIAHLNESGGYWCSKANYVFEGAELLIADGNASFRIAGYAIDRLIFYFVVHDGKTELGTVEVLPVQPTKETEAVMKDLEQKLITVYGGSAFSGMIMIGGYGPVYRKVGAENTAVCLTYQLSEGGVMLVYGKINAFAPEEANVAPLIIDSSNIDGL